MARIPMILCLAAVAAASSALLIGCTPTVSQEAGQVREYSQRTHEQAPGNGAPIEADKLPESELDPDEPGDESNASNRSGTPRAGNAAANNSPSD